MSGCVCHVLVVTSFKGSMVLCAGADAATMRFMAAGMPTPVAEQGICPGVAAPTDTNPLPAPVMNGGMCLMRSTDVLDALYGHDAWLMPMRLMHNALDAHAALMRLTRCTDGLDALCGHDAVTGYLCSRTGACLRSDAVSDGWMTDVLLCLISQSEG